ncbi:MAG TPA: peptidylprolyl isomerase [Candidatus Saccharimonadales bacterium]|jgi:peptidylprolyl isomerase|nr:peptidylprolyl isomerase [Candidatus Saccharimonadales bacterium]
MYISKNAKNIFLGLAVSASVFFLAGCGENQPPQQEVLRDAQQYDIKSYQQRAPDTSPATHRLSVSAPQGDPGAAAAGQDPGVNQTDTKQPPAMQIDKNKTYSAIIKTSEGDITIDLDAKKTPITVNNFVALARQNFYDGTVFHRVMKDFMIQGGDPNGDGSGGPGYKFADESLGGKYTRGTVAMANSGPNTNGSQFFIIQKDYDLPSSYVIFGHVSSGMDAVDKIAQAKVVDNGKGEKSKPVKPVAMDSVQIVEK